VSNQIVLPAKLAGTTQFFPAGGWDFTSLLSVGETISAATVTATIYTGTDSSPDSIVSGAATINGPYVKQLITAGVVGCIYIVVCKVTTSLGQSLELLGLLAIIPDTSVTGVGILTDSGVQITTDSGTPIIVSG
jgi:hypothetical protein